jgi:hypothetical protein
LLYGHCATSSSLQYTGTSTFSVLFIAGINASMNDALNVFDEMGARYTIFLPFLIFCVLILYSLHLY